MGTVFKTHVTRPLPDGAVVVVRKAKHFASWTDEAGRKHTAPVTTGDTPRVRERSSTYTAQYRDGAGILRRVATGCKSLDAARSVLADHERRAEKIRSGIVTQSDANAADFADVPIVEHTDAYIEHLLCKRGKGARRNINAAHIANVRRALRLLTDEFGFRRLRDLNRRPVEQWVRRLLDLPDGERPAPRTVNLKLVSLTSFGNWLVEVGRLAANPLARLRKLDEADDIRRQRRALTADELRRLLTVARQRPVAEFGRDKVRIIDDTRPTASRATWKRAALTFDTLADCAERGRSRVRPDVAARLDRAGRERALVYAVLVTTGLRKGELASLTVADVLFDVDQPVIVLPGTDAKNGRRSTLPIRADVAAELLAWITERAEAVCGQRVGIAGRALPPADVPLLNVPTGLDKIIARDLAAAGIPKLDDRGRCVDVHALRHTFGTHIVAAGIAPRIAQAAMRHSSLNLTMGLYTDPRLLDVAGALAALPSLTTSLSDREPARATGTDDVRAVAPLVALDAVRRGPNGSQWVNPDGKGVERDESHKPKIHRGTRAFPGESKAPRSGLEPETYGLTVRRSTIELSGNRPEE